MTDTIRNFIDGELVESATTEFIDLVDPVTGEVDGRDTGQPLRYIASEEVDQGVDQLRFFAGAARLLEGKSAGEYLEGHTSSIRREPIGVVGQVTPWNYPFAMAIWKIAPALAAGNTVVLKPSDTTPRSTVLLAEIAGKILPAGVLNVVNGDATTGRHLVEHPTPGLVAITGSVRAGIEVASSAARHLKRAHLELGGKAPVVVMPDTDLPRAAEMIAAAAYFNAGQDCTAATRVIVHRSVHDELVDLLVKEAEGTRPGPPSDAEAEAVRMANGVPYGLAASVWTRDHGTADRLTRELDFGCVWVNTHIPFVSEMPHGGFGASGYGKDLSGYGFDDYTRIKHVMTVHY